MQQVVTADESVSIYKKGDGGTRLVGIPYNMVYGTTTDGH